MSRIEIDAVRFTAPSPLEGQLGVLVDLEDSFGLFDSQGSYLTKWDAYEFESKEEWRKVIPAYEICESIPDGFLPVLEKVAEWVRANSAPGSRPPVIGRYNCPGNDPGRKS